MCRIRQDGGCTRVGGLWGWNRKERRGNRFSKVRGKLGQGVGALKRRVGVESPYELWVIVQHSGIFLVLNLMKWDKKNPLFCILKI